MARISYEYTELRITPILFVSEALTCSAKALFILFLLIISFFESTGTESVCQPTQMIRQGDECFTFHGVELVRLLFAYKIHLADITFTQ